MPAPIRWGMALSVTGAFVVASWLYLQVGDGPPKLTNELSRSPARAKPAGSSGHAPSNLGLSRSTSESRWAQAPNGEPETDTPASEPASGLERGVRIPPLEGGESQLTRQWAQMTQEERLEETLLAFERSVTEAERTRDLAQLRSAASSLSVIKADLCATPEGRQLYGRIETRYDELEQQLE